MNSAQIVRVGMLIALFATIGVTSSCEDDNPFKAKDLNQPQDVLPEATQTGANTMGMKVNGKIWVPRAMSGFGGSPPISSEYYNGKVFLHAVREFSNNEKGEEGWFWFRISERAYTEGTYVLNNMRHPKDEMIFRPDGEFYWGVYEIGEMDTTITGTITIKRFDTIAQIIAGTFEASLARRDGKDTLSITDGRFDIKYP